MIRINRRSHGQGIKIITDAIVTLIFALLLQTAKAQTYSQYESNNIRSYIGIILIICSAITFISVAFVIYFRYCANSNLITTTTSITSSSHIISIPSSSHHRGLDPSIFTTFPSFTYSEVKSHKIGKGILECAVCLDEFEDEEIIKLLPKCDHVFHLDCIDAWLRSHSTCPVCRANLDPDQVSGPYHTGSEAVSLLRWTSDETVRSETITETVEIQRRRSATRRTPSLSMIGSFFFSKFGRWNSTGHCVVQPGDDLNRFTLKLPREIRNQLLNRSASALVLPTVSSMRTGYRNSGLRGQRNAAVDDRWSLLGIGSGLFNRSWYRSSPEGFDSVKYNLARPVV